MEMVKIVGKCRGDGVTRLAHLVHEAGSCSPAQPQHSHAKGSENTDTKHVRLMRTTVTYTRRSQNVS